VTLQILHIQRPDGTWIARCEQHRAWKFKSPTLDKNGAAQSLRWHVADVMQFTHWIDGEITT